MHIFTVLGSEVMGPFLLISSEKNATTSRVNTTSIIRINIEPQDFLWFSVLELNLYNNKMYFSFCLGNKPCGL